MLLQEMPWEYKWNMDPPSYIKFRGWKSVLLQFGTGEGHLSCCLGLNQTHSGVCDAPVWISDFQVLLALWCEVTSVTRGCHCSSV